jgi:putative hydrolase of the HAD superfamily
MNEIKGLLVDLFGTIIPRPDMKRHEKFMDSISDILDEDPVNTRKVWRKLYKRRITGVDDTSRRFVDHFLLELGSDYSEEKVKRIDTLWNELTGELMIFFDDVSPVLQVMRDSGLRIGLLTNCGANVPDIFEKSEIASRFDAMIYSSTEKMTKPDVRFFERGSEMLGLEPGQCAFIGDGDNDELFGSRDAGLFTIKIDRGEDSGDYVIKPVPPWDPTISDFNELSRVLKMRNLPG